MSKAAAIAEAQRLWHTQAAAIFSFQFALSPSDFSSVEVPEEEREAAVSRGVRIWYRFPWGQKPIETLWLRGNAELLQTHKGAPSKLQVSRLLLSYQAWKG